MIIKIEDSNIREVNNYLLERIAELFVVKTRNGLSERVFIDLYSDTFSLDYKEGYIELFCFSRIDGNPIFDFKELEIEIISKVRKNKINSILNENKSSINKFISMMKNPKITEIKSVLDNSYPYSLKNP